MPMTWLYVVFDVRGGRTIYPSWSAAEHHPVEGYILVFRVNPAKRSSAPRRT